MDLMTVKGNPHRPIFVCDYCINVLPTIVEVIGSQGKGCIRHFSRGSSSMIGRRVDFWLARYFDKSTADFSHSDVILPGK